MLHICSLLCIQLFTLFLSTALYSTTLHLLSAVDSKSSLSKGVKVDRRNIHRFLKTIAQATEMEFQQKSISAKDLSARSLSNCIEKFDVQKNDVFCFYFSGHGFRSNKKNCPWPSMHFSATNSRFELATIISLIKKKKPRLALILCDSCNDQAIFARGNILIKTIHPSLIIDRTKKTGLKTLFLKTRGTIISTAAKTGTKAWSSPQGGIFTNAFLRSFQRECQKNSPSWKSILSESKRLCKILQRPQFSLHIKTQLAS